ncbi:MAG: prephenate dehydratase [Paludibacteraceae bacterium]|nr:prephenate dehydratase [Paludibacteraceae bacterium]MBP8782440.1 prephenate dehydratase [Paludibacteraceae bacterium]
MKTVAIQGVAGSFHDIAVRNFFKEQEIKLVPCDSFKELFAVIKKDNSIIGAVAIENTIAGSLLPNHTLLRESGFKIVGEYKLRIEHQLVAMPGQTIKDIEKVYSHPIALMQCEDFLVEHPHLEPVESEDTAASARLIAEKKIMGRAAICSRLAAEIYGLEVLAEGIETNKRNYTRFLIIADSWLADEMLKNIKADKSSLVFSLPHEEGSLAKVLSILSYYHVNLTKIQSLPIIGREWEYMFYINLTFDNYMRYRQALDAIRPFTKDLQLLGEYKAFEG